MLGGAVNRARKCEFAGCLQSRAPWKTLKICSHATPLSTKIFIRAIRLADDDETQHSISFRKKEIERKKSFVQRSDECLLVSAFRNIFTIPEDVNNFFEVLSTMKTMRLSLKRVFFFNCATLSLSFFKIKRNTHLALVFVKISICSWKSLMISWCFFFNKCEFSSDSK